MKKYFSIIILFITLLSCSERDNSSLINKAEKYTVDIEDLKKKGFYLYQNDGSNIVVPDSLSLHEQTHFPWFFYINDGCDQCFFVLVLNGETAEFNSLDVYYSEVRRQLEADNNEELLDLSAQKVFIANGDTAFYVEAKTRVEPFMYQTYSMYFMKGGIIYDFTLKNVESEKEQSYNLFQTILFNYSDSIFQLNSKDEIRGFETIE